MQKSICKNCKKEFEYGSNCCGKFCSKKCDILFKKIKVKECIICGKIYTPDKGQNPMWSTSKYCSNDCSNVSKIKGKYVVCTFCKTLVWKTPYDIKNVKKKFCSRRCYNLFKKGKHNIRNYKKGYRAERSCIIELKSKGFKTERSFLSWGIFDVYAFSRFHNKFIQVKSSRKIYPLSTYKKDIEELFNAEVPINTSKELWIKIDFRGWKKYEINDDGIFKYETFEDVEKTDCYVNKIEKCFQIKEQLEKLGYKCFVPIDFNFVIALLENTLLFIQHKRGKLSKKAKETAMKQMPVQFPREFMVSSILWSDDGSEVVLNGNIKFKGSKK